MFLHPFKPPGTCVYLILNIHRVLYALCKLGKLFIRFPPIHVFSLSFSPAAAKHKNENYAMEWKHSTLSHAHTAACTQWKLSVVNVKIIFLFNKKKDIIACSVRDCCCFSTRQRSVVNFSSYSAHAHWTMQYFSIKKKERLSNTLNFLWNIIYPESWDCIRLSRVLVWQQCLEKLRERST